MKIKQESKYIDSQQIKKMYEELEGANAALLKVLHKTGIRISEVKEYVSKLLWSSPNGKNLDETFYDSEIEKFKLYKPVRPTVALTPAKRNGNRLIPIVIDYKEFLDLKSISIEKSALQKRIRSGGYGVSPHDFRATFITNALGLDLNPIKIQRIMGHKELSSTLKYNRLNTEHDLGMYEYITAEPKEGTTSSDVAFLKQQVKMYSEQNAKLKHKLEGKNNV